MARPRNEVKGGESVSVPTRLDKNDVDWIDTLMIQQGYNSRADVMREALKYYRWSKEYKRAVTDELLLCLSDPGKAEQFADIVSEHIFRKLKDKFP